MGTQQFCLRWNNHQTNMLNVFDQLLQSEDFVDVTLACEGDSIKAHKMVLASCSPYFQSLFKANPCKHPIVILKDMKFSELRLIVDFMYKGEINVSQDQLSTLLRTAESLKVKGLAEVSSGAMPQQSSTTAAASHMQGGGHGGSGASVSGVGGVGGGSVGVDGGIVDNISDVVNEPIIEDTSTTQGQSAGSPHASQDGPASPHSRRKRHRPSRRHSNSDNDNDPLLPESSEISFEAIEEPEPKILRPKSEPVELFSEPPVELLMETNPCFDMDNSNDMNNRSQGPPRDMQPTMPSDRLSMPSTSGTQQMSNQGRKTKSAYTEGDIEAALYSVSFNSMSVYAAARTFGIPYKTVWNRARRSGITPGSMLPSTASHQPSLDFEYT